MRLPAEKYRALRSRMDEVLVRDRHALRQQWRKVEREQDAVKAEAALAQLEQRLQQSEALVQARRQRVPVLNYPDLPVAARREEVVAAIRNHQVVVLAGETGSGKTTQLPKLCLEAGRGIHGLIGHTQPRRIAARSVAARIAEELGSTLGDLVGYKVRFTDETRPDSLIKLMTDGVLLAELRSDRFLQQYDTLIIDEAHERSLNIDFLLGYLRQLLPKRPDLKVIITSATIDVERFSSHFENAPVLVVEGRTYPVEVWYRPISEETVTSDEDDLFDDIEEAIPRAVLEAVEECLAHEKSQRKPPGDILVFSSTEREIRDIAEVLRKYGPPHTEILPLYARLSVAEQQRVFQSHPGRRIVISTNVAETSLTVPNIHYVIDPGFARISRYSYRSKVQRLPIEAVSQASANQRKGRCGRIAPGLCIRLYSEADFLSRPEFMAPEIRRTNLASVILQMQDLGFGDIEAFPFVDAPDSRFVNDGFRVLEEIGAVDRQRNMTPLGRDLARFPLDPRLARILMAGAKTGCLREMLIIVAALSVQDPRDRPADKATQADQKHALFRHPESDFLGFVTLWDAVETAREDRSENQRRSWAREHFLSWLRLREWRETHRQLLLLAQDMNWKLNPEPAAYQQVHEALMSGFITQVLQKGDEREYQACRNQKCVIFPGSVASKKQPKWALAAELVETQRVYARTCARIEPEWIERVGAHLLKRTHFEPHWEKKQGRVMAFEQASLYGLVVNPRKKVPFDVIEPVASREIFIRQALIGGEYETRGAFLIHNQKIVREIEALEHKARRRDYLVDEEVQFEFYDHRLPPDVVGARQFESWRSRVEKEQPRLLFMSRELLLKEASGAIDRKDFPDELVTEAGRFRLRYHFEPGTNADGVTLLCPLGLFPSLPWARLEWLVPGMIEEKVVQLLKSLPKAVRRQLVPVPDVARQLLARPEASPVGPKGHDHSVTDKLVELLRAARGVAVSASDFDLAALPAHCFLNVRVVDDTGRTVAEGRNPDELREIVAPLLREQLPSRLAAETGVERSGVQQWDFGDLPEEVSAGKGGKAGRAWVALVDESDGVAVRLYADRAEADAAHFSGLLRLWMLALPQDVRQVRKLVSGRSSLLVRLGPLGKKDQLEAAFAEAVFRETFLADGKLVRTQQEFQSRLLSGRGRLIETGNRLLDCLDRIADEWAAARELLGRLGGVFSASRADAEAQLHELLGNDFMARVPYTRWQHYPRYLRAIRTRIEKLPSNLSKDQQIMKELHDLTKQCQQRAEQLQKKGTSSSLLEDYRWMLEEYRVSLFAQQLKTAVPVSAERLKKLWAQLPQ